MAVGGVVTAVAKTHVQLLAGRALVGIGMAPAECLAGVLVADLFYLVSCFLPTNFTPILNSALINSTSADCPWLCGTWPSSMVLMWVWHMDSRLSVEFTDAYNTTRSLLLYPAWLRHGKHRFLLSNNHYASSNGKHVATDGERPLGSLLDSPLHLPLFNSSCNQRPNTSEK